MKEKKRLRWRIFLVAMALLLVSFGLLRIFGTRQKTEQIRVNGHILTVLVADSVKEQYTGLGKRETLAPYDGMFFPYGIADRHGIVMRDMHFPIDIVWLYRGEVVDIAPNVPPEPGVANADLFRYYPRANATAVLELPAGKAAELNLKIGDRIEAVS